MPRPSCSPPRLREKRPERANFGSQRESHGAEVCRLIPVFIEVFRALARWQRIFGEMQLAEGVRFEIAVRWCLVNAGVFQSGPVESSWVVIWPVLPECLLLYSARQRSTGTPLGSIPVGSRARRGSVQRI